MARKHLKLGEMLLQEGMIDRRQLQSALVHQRNWGGRLGTNLNKLGYISEDELLDFLAKQFHLTRINLVRMKVKEEVLSFIPADKARQYQVLPVGSVEMRGTMCLQVAMSDPTNLQVIDDLQFITGRLVVPVLDTESSICQAIDRHYPSESGAEELLEEEPVVETPQAQAGPAAPEPATAVTRTAESIGEKYAHLLKVLLEKGILSLKEFERLS